MTEPTWQEKISAYCKRYNIPLNYLSETLDEPKVIPMIRGKAFEFVVYEKLKSVLNSDIWDVRKLKSNAQLGFHDVDVEVLHKATRTSLSIECKLAAKGKCNVIGDNTYISIKCMRSRTLGEAMINSLAPKWHVPKDALKVHNDQYLDTDFDFVVTTIGNAFFQTDKNGTFIFSPNKKQKSFLKNFPGENLQDEVFNSLYIASSKDLSIKTGSQLVCTRRKCTNKNNCGFIPNYPVIEFVTNSLEPVKVWHTIDKAHDLLLKRVS